MSPPIRHTPSPDETRETTGSWHLDSRLVNYRIAQLERQGEDQQEALKCMLDLLNQHKDATQRLTMAVEGLKIKSGMIGIASASIAMIGQYFVQKFMGGSH